MDRRPATMLATLFLGVFSFQSCGSYSDQPSKPAAAINQDASAFRRQNSTLLLAFNEDASKSGLPPSKETPPEILEVLKRYGWSIPLCVWRAGEDSRPHFCVTVAILMKKFPFERDFLAARITEAASLVYSADPNGPRSPESVMDRITGKGAIAGCVQKGSNKGVITLGVHNPQNLAAARGLCDSLSTTPSRSGLTFGALIGASPQTPIASISAEGQALYANYYEQCKERQAGQAGRQSVMEGTAAKQKKVDDAQKKAEQAQEDANKKQKEADAAKQKAEEAKVAEEAANKKATDTYNNPNASNDEKLKAGQVAVKAGNDRMAADEEANQKQAEADNAKQVAADRQKDVVDAQKDLDLAKALGDIAADSLPKLAVATASTNPLAKAYAIVDFGSKVLGAYAGRYGFECMEGSCGSTSCEAEAMVRAWEDEAKSYQSQARCNFAATPAPDSDRCYDKQGGLFAVPEVTLAEKLDWACKNMQMVSDVQCNKAMPRDVFKVLSDDPCKSPIGMCAPENSGRGQNPSASIPSQHHGEDITAWTQQSNGSMNNPVR